MRHRRFGSRTAALLTTTLALTASAVAANQAAAQTPPSGTTPTAAAPSAPAGCTRSYTVSEHRRYAKRVFTFMHNIIGHYFPVRFVLLYPAYIYFVAFHAIEWIVSDSKRHQTAASRIWASAGMIVSIVPLWLYWLGELAFKRVRDGAPAHMPLLAARPFVVQQPARVQPSAPMPARASAQQQTV